MVAAKHGSCADCTGLDGVKRDQDKHGYNGNACLWHVSVACVLCMLYMTLHTCNGLRSALTGRQGTHVAIAAPGCTGLPISCHHITCVRRHPDISFHPKVSVMPHDNVRSHALRHHACRIGSLQRQ